MVENRGQTRVTTLQAEVVRYQISEALNLKILFK